MLRRKAYDYLKKWKDRKRRECLLIKGARQVGKTYLVERFGEREYESFIEINFLREPDLKEIFEGSLTADEIYKRMSLFIPGIRMIPGSTLIFLDEIQRCSKARTALKFLAEDARYDVIASGSLLGLHYGMDADKEVEEVESIPVGYETQFTMYSLDFEEFLWAYGYSEMDIDTLQEFFVSGEKVPDAINQRFEALFREYIVVGGMPEVVAAYTESQDFNLVRDIQTKILAAYDDDIANHAKTTEKAKIRRCYDSVPNQLARENKRFSYAQVEPRSGARKYADSITWLADSNLVHTCRNVREPYIPLTANASSNEFKLYVNDSGLLMAKYGDSAKQYLLSNKLKGNAKGGIFENVIAESLIKKGYPLHYYKPSGNSQEIEFIIERDLDVVPIEVKAGITASVSLNHYIDKYAPSVAYKLINGNVGFSGVKHSIPHYMILFI